MQPILSVIMPVYNTGLFLKRCLDSVLSQTLEDFELILVNDGSTDNSLDICREYEKKDSRIKVIDKKNEGAGPTRNAGIASAKGKYLAFPDSDDWLDINTYKVCIEKMKKNDVDLLVFGLVTEVFENKTGRFIEQVCDSIPEVFYGTKQECRNNWQYLYSQMDMGSPCNKIYKTSLVREHGVEYPDLRRMQDGVFNIRYFDKIESFMSINENFYHRRWHSAEFQRKKMPKKFIECAVYHHNEMMKAMDNWDVLNDNAYNYFAYTFSEIVLTAMFEYFPDGKQSLCSVYKHIKAITTHSYVHSFYKKYKKTKGNLRKKDVAILNKWNILLTIDYLLKNRKGKK